MADEEKGNEEAKGNEEGAKIDPKEMAALKLEASQRRVENKELQEKLDKLLAANTKAEETKLAEQGEFKTIAENAQAQVTDLTSQLAAEKVKTGAYQERDESEFKVLLETVPDAFKGIVGDDTLPLEQRLKLAKAHQTGTKPNTPGYKPPGEPGADTLHEQLETAIKNKDVMSQISLKRQIAAKA